MVVFEKFSDLCLVFGPSMYFPILIESHVEKKVKAIIKQHSRRNNNHYFSLLTASPIPTEGTKELISLYEIGLAYHKNSKTVDKAIEKMIDRHLHAFGWFSFTKFVGDPWDKKLIIQRIETLDAQRVIKDLNYLRSKAGVQRKILKATYKSLTLSKKEIEIIELAQSLAYFRTYRLDVYTKAGYHAKQLFELLAEKIGLTLQEFVFLTYEEILSTLKNKQQFPKDEVQRRLTETWQLLFAKGVMTLSYDQPFLVENYQHQEEMMITGQIASSGIATGEVRIIRGVLEFKKMKDKAILVTSMTTPDFVPLMQRASAIVTDEGGITCHAAIVSRELKKPCIIGTKIATQVLKDDDFIEVDANKGIVSVLQKER
ncbi:hypothetical protein HYW21_00425 [Candidatus Woesearchaeota archaeon]|nr:hypothetical protein [Candidatus Woesearchaeota archaeon]